MFAGRGLEDRLAGLVDNVGGDCDFLYFFVRRYLIHDVGHDALYNRPETSCSGVALNGELRDRPDRAVVELKVSAVHSDELLVLLDEIQKGTATIRLDEEGGIAIEDAREKKDGNKENNKGSDVQIPEREGLEHEK